MKKDMKKKATPVTLDDLKNLIKETAEAMGGKLSQDDLDAFLTKYDLDDESAEELLSFIGPPIENSLKKVYNLTDEQAQIYANTFREKYKNEDVYKAKIYNNIDVLLKNLKSNGYKLGIATYKREDYARSLVTHLGFDIFMDLTCGADNENKLTKKDILQKCIFDLKSTPENTVFVGDSLSDGIAANELGCKFIAVT